MVPVIFPTQMLLRADPETSEEMWLINPFNGETLDEHTLEVWLKGNIGRWRNCLMKISTKRITPR
ncbi:protein SirB1 [Klebsiella aerogenes]|nr:protein SirB1 [Klebsiella aerogenes]